MESRDVRCDVRRAALFVETAIAEKFVDHWPGLPHCLTDMKLTYWVCPNGDACGRNDRHLGLCEAKTIDDLFRELLSGQR